jgi:RNA polymerase sigma-70 factor (ECF subfamily)
MCQQIMAKNAPARHHYFLSDQAASDLYRKPRVADEDESMVAGLRKRHEKAFAEMVRRYQRTLLMVAIRITRSHEDSEDVVQDAFLKVFQNIESFRGDSLFRTWLTRVVMNEALMKIRKNPRHHMSIDDHTEDGPGSPIRELAGTGCTPEEFCSLREIESMALALMARVSPTSQHVVKLCMEMELSPTDAAKRLKLKLSTVKSRLWTGREELRRALGSHFSPQKRYSSSRSTSGARSRFVPGRNQDMLSARSVT